MAADVRFDRTPAKNFAFVAAMKTIRFLFFLCLVFVPRIACGDDSLLCLKETARREREDNIQTNLLSAIALVESGRYSKEYPSGIAWPWTVTAEGRGGFYPSKKEAAAAVRGLQAQGVANIDVGCMQINLKYHPEAFKSIEEALSPSANIAYAATFLKRHYEETKSWGIAATRYHSKTDNKALRYEDKLLDAWKRLTKYGNPAAAEIRATQKDVSRRALRDVKKRIREETKEKKAETSAEPKAKRILPGSPESKALADQWRKAKLEEYMARKKAEAKKLYGDAPVFEEAVLQKD